ncbi:MAG: hypothetical protein RSD57_15785 [Comamonas sp.]
MANLRTMLGVTACVLAPLISWAAPGEDPIVLTKPVEHLQLPMNNGPTAAASATGGMPTNVKAKIARLEAKAFSDMTDGIYTDADIKATTTAGTQKKSCIQDVGSNTSTASSGFQRFGPGSKQQIVVLRGDLVNICN